MPSPSALLAASVLAARFAKTPLANSLPAAPSGGASTARADGCARIENTLWIDPLKQSIASRLLSDQAFCCGAYMICIWLMPVAVPIGLRKKRRDAAPGCGGCG